MQATPTLRVTNCYKHCRTKLSSLCSLGDDTAQGLWVNIYIITLILVGVIIFYYLLAANILVFVMYGIDKYNACRRGCRIPERKLVMLAVAGGSIGAVAGMYLWWHKTKHLKFRIGLPLILVAQVLLACWLASA